MREACSRAGLAAACGLAMAGCLAMAAEVSRWDFEAGLPAGGVAKGDVQVQRDTVHGGTQAVRVGKGGELLLPAAAADGFGTVSMWVHDAGGKLAAEAAKQRLYGPLWGVANAADQRLVFGLLYAPYLSGNDSYGWISTAAGGWGSRRYARAARQAGWRQWVLTVRNETDITVAVDGRPATGFDIMTSLFFHGFNGVCLRGAVDTDDALVVDDIEVTWQPGVLAERTRPLPGEKRRPPEATPLALRPERVGQHPRLFFAAADVAGLRERCRTTHAAFFRQLMGGAASYLEQMPPATAAQCADDQLMQQWGWWRLQTLAFAYVCTGEERYARQAAEWLNLFVAYPDWGSGEEVNQSMGAGNFLTGIACAYDWCYDRLTDAERQAVRAKLLRQVGEMAWAGFLDPKTAGYWKGDRQNNHRHHRLCGLLLASLAVLGEEPEAAAYAGLAADDLRQVVAALPPDGSNHEGPSYAAFGHSYVVRAMDALRHTTGEDLFAATPAIANMPYFRAHTLTPGFHTVFNFGDCGGGSNGASAYYFNHYQFKAAADARDPWAQALMKMACDAEPGSFSYFPWPLLWYDADLAPGDLATLPRWRYFDDLEMVTYRSSWTDPEALAVVLKCGPYGGHRLNDLRQGNEWVNVAHDHPDANHVMLFWKGQMWAGDDGYPKRDKAGRNHNLVLVDGKGPLQRGGGWLQPIANMGDLGRIDRIVRTDGLFAARGDAARYYPGTTSARRWLAVVRDRFVVVCDRLTAPKPCRFDWLLHSDAAWTEADGGAYRLGKGGRELHLAFARPTERQARLEKDELEGKQRGQLLTVSPVAPTPAVWFVAVFAAEPLPPLAAEETADGLRLRLGPDTDLSFAEADGLVELQR